METEQTLFTSELTVFQLRAARRALNLTVREVAKEASLATGVIVRSEAGDLYKFPEQSSVTSIAKLRVLYESEGIRFLPNNTIQLYKHISDIQFRTKATATSISS
tara:strand:+ start:861 stop:1175 length:315 start_codon:yes stop_codon:yes gene_type:complete